MPLNIADLRAALERARTDHRLHVDVGFLQLAPAHDLFARFLPGAVLDVTGVTTVDTDGLRVTGQVTLLGQAASTADVVFLADAGGTTVEGVRVDVALLPGGLVLPAELAQVPSALERVGLGTSHLVFGIEPGGDAGPLPAVGCGVELLFPDKSAAQRPYVWGYPPVGDVQTWRLAGEFPAVPLSGLDDLLPWATLPSGGFDLLPDDVAKGASLRLTALSLDFALGAAQDGEGAPEGGAGTGPRWLAAGMRIGLGRSWEPLPGLLKLDDLHADFSVADPLGKGCTAAVVLGGRVTLAADVVLDVGVSLPEKSVSGVLVGPLAVGTLLTDRFPGVPVPKDLKVTRLAVGAELGRGPAWGYGLDLRLGDVWHVDDEIALSEVGLSLLRAGDTTTAEATASWKLGEGTVDVHGTWQTGAGWRFEMDAAHIALGDAFAAFGIQPPPVLQGVTVEQLTVTYDSATKKFELHARAAFPLGAIAADLDVAVKLTKRTGGPGYDQEYTGGLTLAVPQDHGDPRTLAFSVSDVQHAQFVATCTDSKGVSFADVARLLGVTDPSAGQILDRLGALDALTIAYTSARKAIVLAAHEKNGGSLVAVSDKPPAGTRAWAVRVGVALDARLSQVPLLQGQIPEAEDVGVRGLGALVALDALPADRVTELNKALTAAGRTLPLLPAEGMAKGMAFTVDLKLPGRTGTTSLAVRGAGRGDKAPAVSHANAQNSDSTPAPPRANAGDGGGSALPLVAWIGVQRSIGPLTLRRVGAGFADGTVWVLFDASLGMAGLTVGVDGLGLGIPLSDPRHPHFRLDGLSVGYSRPPLAIEGALIHKQDKDYDPLIEGALAVRAEEFGLTALGAYARPTAHPDQTSLFIFGKANGEFGGPPPVQVTGIMAGFGFNTDVRLPEGDQVLDFPFLQDLAATEPLKVLEKLMGGGKDAWVRPAAGQLWFAAGLEFRIFEFLDGQALLVLEVGDDFAVAVLGTAEARFPTDRSLAPYARVRLGLSAKYRASEGVLKLTAQLAPGSFLLDEACVLTGGFALYTWFDGENAGDFALTLGGYHPKYPVPAHYPRVPRLGFNWPVTSELTISGGSYFALTPGAIMAGGALDVNYRSGDLHAWLTAHADLLIEWAPFHFDADIGISIGVSFVLDLWLVRETISVEVGASLRLWGPPTAGEVTIHLWFISFTIGFGDGSARDDQPAPWADVVKQLPPKRDAVRLVPMDGLVPAQAGDGLWVVTPGAFSFAVRTAVPVSGLDLTKETGVRKIDGAPVNIRPRRDQGKDLDSTLTVTLTKHGVVQDLSTWYAGDTARNRASLPAALWGAYDGKLTTGSAQRVDDQLMGVDLRLPAPHQGGSPGHIKAGTIAHDDREPDGILPLRQAATARTATLEFAAEAAETVVAAEAAEPADAAPALSVGALTGDLTGGPVDQSRDRLFAAMGYLGVSPGTNQRLDATDGLVAGDVEAKPDHTVPGTPTESERLYVLGEGQTVTPVDAQSLTAYAPFTSAYEHPTQLAVSPDGTRLFAADPASQHIDAFDITANPPGKAVDTTTGPPTWLAQNVRAASFSPDSKWAYATYAQPNQLEILNVRDGAPKAVHTYGTDNRTPADVVPALPWDDTHQRVYIALPDSGAVLELDVANLQNPMPVGDPLPAGPSPTRLAVDPKGRWVYALNEGGATVTVVDVTARKAVATLRTGTGPSALAASPDGRRLYVTNATTGTVSVFDTSGEVPREAAEPVWIGPEPIALTVSAASDRLYVACAKNREVRVVDIAADPPALLDVTVPLTDDPVALAVTVPPPVQQTTRTTEGGAA
ncbi:beta-propeller fold lactonase family protein [Streptomyces sp. HU2014]|uniref:YncE family protein n=1 Tax=Streptomyces sp. HU2014 TaxID=2939414 RepID=UPI00200D51A6|nr:YncE family protein [Streptomyces sp. HU2014]UQI46446.1 beta-propeller fold lactonase family protein [Streptomyces sp. HU2014]